MKTIALRFSDNFAPKEGTIEAHQRVIDRNGFVLFGKLGTRKISQKVIDEVFRNGPVMILLIHTQSKIHYLAKVESIDDKCQNKSFVPEYYRDRISDFSNWLKIKSFTPVGEEKLKDFYTSSGNSIFDIYKKSMGSYFVVEYKE